MINRFRNILLTLKNAPLCDWRISRDYCPLCCRKTFFISFTRTALGTRCLSCANTCVNLSLIPVIRSVLPIGYAYEMSSYGGTLDFLKQHVPKIEISEFYPNIKLGSIFRGVRIEDVQMLTFDCDKFDLVTSNQVMEHVPDDIAGFKEIFRVLKPRGYFIFSVPLYDYEVTIQRAVLIDGSIKHLKEPEYHGSRLEGPNSVLTFWNHSFNDIVNRLSKAGFVSQIVEVSITPSQGESYKVLKCQKPKV